MEIKILFGSVASILTIFSFIPYLLDIFKKKTTPHSYTWLIWSILQTTGTVAVFTNHGGFGALGLGIGSLFCVSIFILSLRYGTKNIAPSDLFSLVGALAAIVIWIFTKNALYSVILISFIDFMGYIPTYRKGYEEPYSETVSLYFMNLLASILAIFALSEYSLTTVLYLAELFLANSTLVTLLLYRRRRI